MSDLLPLLCGILLAFAVPFAVLWFAHRYHEREDRRLARRHKDRVCLKERAGAGP